ncbi:hypothetical protein PVAND_004141 [Polypedilum vanderplanki]|uniref:Hormone-sensitive lipase n=1 Tax=Polypedilum vanderplanki TaxID=319348 RepID=A0A9J6BXA4_POLVA|nr:hypothetical protein PVAND_004141 [Polypedilum vanderplanki]
MEKHDKATENFIIWEALKSIIINNIDYYKNDETTNGLKLHDTLLEIIDQIDEARPLFEEVESFASEYDLDENTQANGYRSFLKVFDSAINHTLKIIKYVTENRSGLLFRKTAYTKEIEACNHLLAALITTFHQLKHFHLSSKERGNLFPEHSPDEILQRAQMIDQFAFYGRCLGFQFYNSVKAVLKFISISMACYSESYYSNNGKFIKATNSMFTSGKYYFDPEIRARRVVNLSQHASVDFCKSFWQLADLDIVSHSIPFVNYNTKVNRLFKINAEPLKISKLDGESIEVNAPGTIQLRLISSHKREGMIIGDKIKNKVSDQILPKSKALILHAHGGGFVAQSSKSHLVYLLEWAVNLNVPILSLDYSLSPEFPYPRPLEEMFYAYCWVLNNADKLGSTIEKIIFCGDSAGANLCLATLLKAIDMKIRKPDGLFLAYCPILVAFDPSPSRLLCLMDPLIPMGFLIRCLKAYSNAQSIENNNNEDATSVASNLQQLEEIKRAKVEHNEELKRSSLNVDIEHEFSENSEKSDSFEEISCFERHQTDSDIKAHISQVSDIASNDTLAGTSFLTGTDFKNSRDTIEVVSPIDSIQSATSLEEDSLPITIHKNERTTSDEMADIDLQPTTSEDTTIKNSNNQFVDEFTEKYKYILDTQAHDDGKIKPVLRKVSRTKSEENIIFDVSRDTISVQTIQQKVHQVASTLVHACSTTLDQITKTNRPIIRNYSCDDADEFQMLDNETVPPSLSNEFLFTVSKDPFLSPYYADDEMLKQFPPIRFLSLTLDACLDDSIMYAKRLKKLNVDYKLDILDGLPHGFLNFSRLSKDAHEGSKIAMKRIAELLNITLDDEDTKVKYFC